MTKDKWSTLPMKDRAELINLGVQNGITNIKDIKEIYNKHIDAELQKDNYNDQIDNVSNNGNFPYQLIVENSNKESKYEEGGKLEIPDKWKPWYWGKKEYDTPTLKEAIEKAYREGRGRGTIMWKGKAYKAQFNRNDTKEYFAKYTTPQLESGNPRFLRIRRNDSPTNEYSEKIEDGIAKRQNNFIKKEKELGINSEDYYIPYREDKEIKIPQIGRVSSNVLDSIYVNTQRAGIPFLEGLGLAAIETGFGAAPNLSIKGYIENFEKRNGRKPTEKEVKERERAMLNSSYARNFGGIYPQFLINDHEWFMRGWEKSNKYKEKLSNIKSPLEHGFTLYKMGLYNTGMPNHTDKVKQEGERIVNTPVIQRWIKENEYKYKKK